MRGKKPLALKAKLTLNLLKAFLSGDKSVRVIAAALPRQARFALAGMILLCLAGTASAQDFSSPYYRHGWGPVNYDQGYFVGMPQYPAAGYGGGLYRRNGYSAGDIYVVGDVETEVLYAPIVERYLTPVTTYAEVDTIVGYEPVVRYRRVHHRRTRRRCDCNGFY